MAEEYNGWKNQATWSINSLHMESILGFLDDGWHEEAIKGLILAECQTEDMTRTGRDLFMCAWGSVDWFTIFKIAKEIRESELARRVS